MHCGKPHRGTCFVQLNAGRDPCRHRAANQDFEVFRSCVIDTVLDPVFDAVRVDLNVAILITARRLRLRCGVAAFC